MKKLCNLLLLFLCFSMVNASVYGNIDFAANAANNMILGFANHELYIVNDNTNYAFRTDEMKLTIGNEIKSIFNNVIYSNDKYQNGGLLNKDEYLITLDSELNTYLNDGMSYWTMTTDENTGYNYYIGNLHEPSIANNETSLEPRITQYVQEDTEITGFGTFDRPWYFIEKNAVNSVKFVDKNNGSNKFEDYTVNINYGDSKTVTLELPIGRKMNKDNPISCTNKISYSYEINSDGIVVNLNKIKKGSVCTLNTENNVYSVYVSSTNTSYGTVTPLEARNVEHGNGLGYEIIAKPGYKYSSNTCNGVMNTLNSYMSITNITSNKNCTVSFERANINVEFDTNGGDCESSGMIVEPGSTYKDLPNATKLGYIFNGWYTQLDGGAKVSNNTIVPLDAVDHTLYAHWTVANYSYTVNHYLMNTSGTYVLNETENKNNVYGTSLILKDLAIINPTYNVVNGIVYKEAKINNSVQTVYTLTDDVIINLYYERKKYRVTVIEDNYTASVTGGDADYYYGSSVKLFAIPIAKYKFSRYVKNGVNTTTRTYTFTMGTSAVIVNAYSTKCDAIYSCPSGYSKVSSICYTSPLEASEYCSCISSSSTTHISEKGYYIGQQPSCDNFAYSKNRCSMDDVVYIKEHRCGSSNYYCWKDNSDWKYRYKNGNRSYDPTNNWTQWKYVNSSSISWKKRSQCYGTVITSTCKNSISCPKGTSPSGSSTSGKECYVNATVTTPDSCD